MFSAEYKSINENAIGRQKGKVSLQGEYIPPNRVGVGKACICEKKESPDGTVDSSARFVIDLEYGKLS